MRSVRTSATNWVSRRQRRRDPFKPRSRGGLVFDRGRIAASAGGCGAGSNADRGSLHRFPSVSGAARGIRGKSGGRTDTQGDHPRHVLGRLGDGRDRRNRSGVRESDLAVGPATLQRLFKRQLDEAESGPPQRHTPIGRAQRTEFGSGAALRIRDGLTASSCGAPTAGPRIIPRLRNCQIAHLAFRGSIASRKRLCMRIFACPIDLNFTASQGTPCASYRPGVANLFPS
jgi:hypothetical protein